MAPHRKSLLTEVMHAGTLAVSEDISADTQPASDPNLSSLDGILDPHGFHDDAYNSYNVTLVKRCLNTSVWLELLAAERGGGVRSNIVA